MQANPNRSRLQSENLGDLFGCEFLHVVEHENDAQRSRYAQDRLMQQMVLLGASRLRSGPLPHPEATAQFFIAGINSSSDSMSGRSVGRLAAHAPAAVSGDGVEPDRQLLRILDFGQVP